MKIRKTALIALTIAGGLLVSSSVQAFFGPFGWMRNGGWGGWDYPYWYHPYGYGYGYYPYNGWGYPHYGYGYYPYW